MYRSLTVIALVVFFASARPSSAAQPLNTVPSVDLNRYLGTWYEVASYPAWFQRKCTGSTAEYAFRDDGMISVVNSCRKASLDGKLKQVQGRAKIIDTESKSKLKVSFFGPFWGHYWIIDLDPEYRWAVVGVPNRKYLWILSRAPQLDEGIYREILSRLPAHGYDPDKLNRTLQPLAPADVPSPSSDGGQDR